MESPRPTYRLDTLHLEHVLETLQREHEKAKLSRFQRVSFTLLQIAVYAIPLALLFLWLIFGTGFERSPFGEAACYLVLLVLVLAATSLLVLVPMNLSLVRKIVRQARLDRQLGELLPEAGEVTVRPVRTPSQALGLKILAGALSVLVAAAIALAIIGEGSAWKVPVTLVVLGGPAYLVLAQEKLRLVALRFGLWLLTALMAAALILAFVFPGEFGLLGFLGVFVVVLLPALVLVSNRYLARSRARLRLLEDIDRLRASLARHRRDEKTDSVGYVELPSAEAERLVEVEQSLIRQRRVAAIASARADTASGRTIFKTLDARSRIEALDRRTRLLVESQLEELSFEPQPEGAAADSAAGTWRLAVPGTAVEVVYEVADDFAQVRILAVETAAAAGGRNETPGRSADA